MVETTFSSLVPFTSASSLFISRAMARPRDALNMRPKRRMNVRKRSSFSSLGVSCTRKTIVRGTLRVRTLRRAQNSATRRLASSMNSSIMRLASVCSLT